MDRLKNLKIPAPCYEDISSPDDNDNDNNEDIVDDLSQKLSKKRKKQKHKHHHRHKKLKKSSADKSPTLSLLDIDRLSPSSLNFRGSPEGEKRLREKLTQKFHNMSRDSENMSRDDANASRDDIKMSRDDNASVSRDVNISVSRDYGKVSRDLNESFSCEKSITPIFSIKSAVVMKENDKNRKSRDFDQDYDYPSTSFSKPQQPSSVVNVVKNPTNPVRGGAAGAVDLRRKIDRSNYRSMDFSPQPIRERRASQISTRLLAPPTSFRRRPFSREGPQRGGYPERGGGLPERGGRPERGRRSPIGHRRRSSAGSRDSGGAENTYNSYEEYYKTEDFVQSKLSPPPPERHSTNQETANQKNMPEHIKWLHDRWARYDHPSFFSTSQTLKPVDFKEKSRDLEDYKNWRQNSTKTIEKNDNSSIKNANPGQKPDDFKGKPGPAPHRSGFKPKRRPQKPEPPHPSRFKQTSDYFNWMYGGRSRDQIPHLLTFKEFLMSFPDNNDHVTTGPDGHVDEEKEQQKLINLYNEYKLKYKRRVFREFFDQHKDEEWFLEKYHPSYRVKRDLRRRFCVQKRLDVFMYLLVRGWIEAHAEYTDSRKVRKLLDAACVLLEGGKEEDIMLLSDFDYVLEEKREESYEIEHQDSEPDHPAGSGSAPDEIYGPKIEKNDEKSSKNNEKSSKNEQKSSEMKKDEGEIEENLDFMMKRDEEVLTEKKKEDTTLEIMQHAKDYTLYVKKHTQAIEFPAQAIRDVPDNVVETRMETSYIGQGVFVSKPKFFTENNRCLSETSLHKSASLCLRDLSPKIFRSELAEICAEAHGGFTRLALSDPDPKRNFVRQGIASFWHNANLMKICWFLRGKYLSTRQKLTVIEYRDFFSKRIATVDGLSADKSIVLRDVQLCKSLIEFLDKRHNLWDPDSENDTPSAPKINPLLVNLNECLTYHLQQLLASGEITDLSDVDVTAGPSGSKKSVDRDENLVRILDRLILYLRIVHSVDYYGCKFYEKEDEEPRRIGLVHLRGPSNRQATPKQLANYIQAFEEKLHHLLPNETRLADEHVELLGMKKPETEIDKFVSDNIIATSSRDGLAKCCFCYKRFTSKEFAAQHVIQRHVDKIEDFKLELTAFNNYLYDPNRLCHVQFT